MRQQLQLQLAMEVKQRLPLLVQKLSRHRLIVVPCDKNLGNSVWRSDDYLRLCMRTLREFPSFRAAQAGTLHNLRARIIVHSATAMAAYHPNKPNIMERTIQTLLNKPDPKAYCLPKLHKILDGTVGQVLESSLVPGRPIVNMRDTVFSTLDKWLEEQLRIILHHFKSTFHCSIIDGCDEAATRLRSTFNTFISGRHGYDACVRMGDITALYTNLRHTTIVDNILALQNRMSTRQNCRLSRTQLSTNLSAFLDSLYFVLGDEETMPYTQHVGIPMGASCSPALANLVLLEAELRVNASHGFFLMRYLDDFLYIGHGSGLVPFLEAYRNLGLKYTFTGAADHKSGVFLDMYVSVVEEQDKYTRIVTDLHVKEAKINSYVHWLSEHPPGVFRGIIFGQVHRIFRACLDNGRRRQHMADFEALLLQRGWSRRYVHRTLLEAISYELGVAQYGRRFMQARRRQQRPPATSGNRQVVPYGSSQLLDRHRLHLQLEQTKSSGVWSLRHLGRPARSYLPLSRLVRFIEEAPLDVFLPAT